MSPQASTQPSAGSHSRDLFERARAVLPGGVNSPVRAFRSVGGSPPFIARGEGATVWDEDGRSYVDFVCAWGPLLFGHAFPPVVRAVQDVAARGVCLGAPTRLEVEFAETLIRLSGWLEQVRVMNSGTEAAMTAARLVRAATGRPTLLKFHGGYHGHADAFLAPAVDPSEPLVNGALSSDAGAAQTPAGSPAHGEVARSVLAIYNDLESVRQAASACRGGLAAIFVEPVCANVGVIAPQPGFLEGLRAICDEHGALLVFDEVVTGFRIARGGAVERFGVRPDLVIYGKVIGGGLPIGAVGGPRALLEQLAPEGPVFQAGTFCGNPVSMAAGLAQLRAIDTQADLYERLEQRGAQLEARVLDAIRVAGARCQFARVGSMWTLFFSATPIQNGQEALACDAGRFSTFFHTMLRQGITLAPSQMEANFISTSHSVAEIARTAGALARAIADVR